MKMPVYKLEPIKGTEEHPDWLVSSVPPTPVWLRAGNADHARQRMHLATFATGLAPGALLKAPWVNAGLVRCSEDASYDVPPDKALMANGKISITLT
jgi:hypothetical protein